MASSEKRQVESKIDGHHNKKAKPNGDGKSVAIHPINSEFISLLLSTKVEHIVEGFEDNRLYVAQRTDKLVQVFKGLIHHNFMSVPVLQRKGSKWFGFLDIADIVKFIVNLFGRKRLSTVEEFWHLAEKEDILAQKTVDDVIVYPLARRNPFHPVTQGYSLLHAFEILAREPGLHRVPVIGQDRQLITVITQTHLLRFLHKHSDHLGAKKEKPIKDINGVFHPVITITENQETIAAFDLMLVNNVGGVAVVDEAGKLVAAISLTDLKGIASDGRLFWRLYQTVHNYLIHLKKDYPGERPRSVVCCTGEDTLGSVIEKLAEYKIHRIFIVDSDKKPVGVVSLRDILLEVISVNI